jgi:predicted GNAT family acetyltransferase
MVADANTELTVIDNTQRHRFELHVDGVLAGFTSYRIEAPGQYAFTHTQTLPAFAGRGVASTLIAEVLGRIRTAGYAVLPYCPFVNRYLRGHPEYADLVPAAQRRQFGITGSD